MKHLDLFSGIGGFALAASQVFDSYEIVSFCEIDLFCQKVLQKNFPGVVITSDIRDLHITEHIDLLTGGFPCQPFSTAGKQEGSHDDRYLWPEMLRVIEECQPTWIIAENVAGIINMALEEVCADLENKNYEVWPVVVPACAVGAPHRRDRVWILAHSHRNGFDDNAKNRQSSAERSDYNPQGKSQVWESERRSWSRVQTADWQQNWQTVVTELCGVDDGIPTRLDKNRIKSLGNAIVPQVAVKIMEAIKEVENLPIAPLRPKW